MRNLTILSFALLLLVVAPLYGQKYKDDFSRFEKKRHARKNTFYVVLHTTEAGNSSSLAIVKRQGTCNYLVTTDGVIHRIISEGKVAKHAGVSMWNRHSNLSNSTVGIEVAGFHNKPPTANQISALKSLISHLKNKYNLSDDKIVCHSMVAYANPNQYWDYKERGRKRCGMLFATPKVRKSLGLSNTFCSDPDVVEGRIHNDADPYLASILYCGKKQVCVRNTPDKRIIDSNNDNDDDRFEGFRLITKKLNARKIAGSEFSSYTTIYFLSNGMIRTGAQMRQKEILELDPGTKVLVGYVYGGKISGNRSAYSVVGSNWDEPSTFYRFPDGTIKSGDNVDQSDLLSGTIVLFRQ